MTLLIRALALLALVPMRIVRTLVLWSLPLVMAMPRAVKVGAYYATTKPQADGACMDSKGVGVAW